MENEIPIHKALSMAKNIRGRLEKRLAHSSRKYRFVSTVIGTSLVCTNGVPVHVKEESIRHQYEPTEEMIHQYFLLKRSINMCNMGINPDKIHMEQLDTIVLENKRMTISDLIVIRSFSIPMKKKFYQFITDEINTATIEIASYNERISQICSEELLKKAGDAKMSPEEMKEFITTFQREQAMRLVDPLQLARRIENLKDHLHSLETEVDSTLLNHNANHNICIFDIL